MQATDRSLRWWASPGVGKSRLVWEFTRSHRTEHWLVLESASVSYGKASAYRPVIDLLKGYFQIEERDDARRKPREGHRQAVDLGRSVEADVNPFARVARCDLRRPDLGLARVGETHTHSGMLCRRLLLREAQLQPLVVVFEDLHWIDNETQALLDALVESLPTARILLLVNFRPEYRPRWTTKTYDSQLRIDPLAGEGAEDLVRMLLGTDPSIQPLAQRLDQAYRGESLVPRRERACFSRNQGPSGKPRRLSPDSAAHQHPSASNGSGHSRSTYRSARS